MLVKFFTYDQFFLLKVLLFTRKLPEKTFKEKNQTEN
jgi:hypothetical protein